MLTCAVTRHEAYETGLSDTTEPSAYVLVLCIVTRHPYKKEGFYYVM